MFGVVLGKKLENEMLQMFLTASRGFALRDVKTNDFRREMLEVYNSFDEKVRSSIEFIFIVKLHFEVSDEVLAEIALAPFSEGKDHGVWTDVALIEANRIGFNPDKHAFVCHKCGGLLAGNVSHKLCVCISGWIRPYDKYIDSSSLRCES